MGSKIGAQRLADRLEIDALRGDPRARYRYAGQFSALCATDLLARLGQPNRFLC